MLDEVRNVFEAFSQLKVLKYLSDQYYKPTIVSKSIQLNSFHRNVCMRPVKCEKTFIFLRCTLNRITLCRASNNLYTSLVGINNSSEFKEKQRCTAEPIKHSTNKQNTRCVAVFLQAHVKNICEPHVLSNPRSLTYEINCCLLYTRRLSNFRS